MNRNRFLLGAVLLSFLGINTLNYLRASDFPEGSPKFETGYDAAMAESKKTGKPVIVVFSASWCGPCKVMKRDVYPSKEVKEYHDKFIWAYLDTDLDSNKAAVSKFQFEGIPHIEFVSPDGSSLGNQTGSTAPKDFAKQLKGVLKAAAKVKPAAPAGKS